MDKETKISVLAKIAKELNAAGVVWAVGGSMLLYFKNITGEFHDIDIMVLDEDADTAKEVLLQMGTVEPSEMKPQYKTKTFLEFSINGVDVDVMAGFSIVKDGITHDCALAQEDISEFIMLENEKIPLQSVAAWRRNYVLMGKDDKVRLIDTAARLS